MPHFMRFAARMDTVDAYRKVSIYRNDRDNSVELVRMHALVVVFALVSRGGITDEIVESWRGQIEQLKLKHGLEEWLKLVVGLFVTGEIDAAERTRTGQDGWCCQCLASLRLATYDEADPNLLIQCHGLWLSYFKRLPYRSLMGSDVAKLVSESWTRCANRPFLLVGPRLTVPALRRALSASEEGWEHVDPSVSIN